MIFVYEFFQSQSRHASTPVKTHRWANIMESNDTLAERLRRRPAKPMGSPRVGSNPTGVVLEKFH